MHEVCEHDLTSVTPDTAILYYDDEELDAFAGIASDAYTPQQEETFRYVFETMWESDVEGWVHSLTLRGIALPDSLKDEVLLVISDHPSSLTTATP
jgi:hypothetical protein